MTGNPSFFGSLFGGKAAPTNTPTAPTPTGDPAGTPAPTQQPAEPTGGQQQQQQQPQGLAMLEALFQDQPADPNAAGVPELHLTPELLKQATGDRNFMTGVSEEMLAQVQQGDPAALIKIIEQVGRNSYEQAMLDSTALTGRFAGTRADYAAQQAAKGIRGQVIESQVDVKSLSPTGQAMFKQVAAKVAERNPSASAAEVQDQATAILQEMAKEFNFSGRKEEEAKPANTDWAEIFKRA